MLDNVVNVRQMNKKEIKTVSNLWNKLAYNQTSRDKYYKSNSKDLLCINNEAYFKNCYCDSNCFIFVADYKNRIIGFSELWLCKKDFFFNIEDYAYILHLFVDTGVKIDKQKDFNPLYVPYALCKACESKALEKGYKYMCGDVFDFNNEMKTILKFLKFEPYRIRYVKKLEDLK